MIVARVQTLVLTHLPSVCCFSDPFSRCTRKRLPLMSTHRLLVTWYLWSPYVAINELRAVSIIITKPSPPFPVCDIVLIPVLLPIFLHGCEIKSGSGLGTRLMSDMRFISEILFTASKKKAKVAHSLTCMRSVSWQSIYPTVVRTLVGSFSSQMTD